METRIEEEILITRLSTSAKKKFAEIGLECHKIGDVCSFCGNDINERAFSELETYFSASKVKNTNDLIDVTILKIGETLEKVKYNRDFKEDFYPEYQDKASDLQLDYTKLLNEWKEYLESLMKALEEKKKNYEDITKQQKQIRTLRQVYTNKEKSIRDLKNEILNDIKEILENSKKLLGYDEQKLQQNIFNKLNKYSKYKLRVKELETNTNEMKQLKEDNIKLVEHITKLEKKLVSADELDKDKSKLIKDYMNREKEEKRFTNSEVANVTQKYENELKEKNQTIKQQKQHIDTLESKVNDYEEYIIDNNLSEDFNNRNNKKHNINRKI